jgi:membrane protein required for colicin V production
MSLADVVILILVGLSMLAGFRSGLIRSVFSLAGLVLGIIIASWKYKHFADEVMPITKTRALSEAIWFCLLVIGVTVVAGIAGLLVKKLVHWVGLGWVDNVLGLVFGFLRGALLITVCVMTIAAFFPDTRWLKDANLAKYFIGMADFTTHMTSEELKKRILDGLAELREHSPAWLHPDQTQ